LVEVFVRRELGARAEEFFDVLVGEVAVAG
jgi:hypothetical protein